jgi:hypothetical protein
MTHARRWLSVASLVFGLALALVSAGCASDNVNSEEEAMKAYLGLDASIDKAITLGFAGFNAASSANISPQTVNGTLKGTLTVTGQVDQGASANKGMRLFTAYSTYSDDNKVVYDSVASALPALTMQLKSIPTGTLSGTLVGDVTMSGELKGTLTLNLTFTGTLQAGSGVPVTRAPGSTHITGTATSPAGTYTVDVIR